MEQKIKTQDALTTYRIISTAKYTKMDDADKIKIWKIARALKPFATQFDDESSDAAERFKEGFKDFDERFQKAQQYEIEVRKPNCDASKLPIGAAEYQEFISGDFSAYNKLVNDAIKEFADKEITVEFDKISEDAFGKLMASNEWTMAQVVALDGIVTE